MKLNALKSILSGFNHTTHNFLTETQKREIWGK